jgi:hypothetical protein
LLGCSYEGRVGCYPGPVEAAGTQPGRVASGPTERNIWDNGARQLVWSPARIS